MSGDKSIDNTSIFNLNCDSLKTVFRGGRIKDWLLLFIGPLTMGLVYLGRAMKIASLSEVSSVKETQEMIAMPMVGIALAIFLYIAIKTNRLISWMMVLLSANFLWREWNQLGARYGVYLILAIFGVIWFSQFKKIVTDFNRRGIGLLMLFSGFTYLLSQLVSKRVFKARGIFPGLPDEPLLHVQFEELTETAAHFTLIVVAISMYSVFKRVGYFSKSS